MRTARLYSSRGTPFPTPWMPYAPGYPTPKYPTAPHPAERTWDQEGIWHQRYPNPPPPVNKMTDTRLWKHYLPPTTVAGGI